MFTLTLPFGYQEISADAQLTLGNVVLKGQFSENVFTVGDPVAAASLGWNKENWHWTVSGALNVPIGDYDETRSANFAFNRWGLDTTGALTYLDLGTGWEASVMPGFTFNGENDDTDYDSGTEFHFEASISKTFKNGLMLGLVVEKRKLRFQVGYKAIESSSVSINPRLLGLAQNKPQWKHSR